MQSKSSVLTPEDAERAFDQFIATFEAKYPKATNCLPNDRDSLLTFYDFPQVHWHHLRTTNPLESTFAIIRHRTTRTKGSVTRNSLLHMTFIGSVNALSGIDENYAAGSTLQKGLKTGRSLMGKRSIILTGSPLDFVGIQQNGLYLPIVGIKLSFKPLNTRAKETSRSQNPASAAKLSASRRIDSLANELDKALTDPEISPPSKSKKSALERP